MSEKTPALVEIENFVPPSYADTLDQIICKNPEFLWQYNASTNNLKAPQIMNKDQNSYESDQFVHALYQEGAKRSPFFDVVFPFFYFLEEKTGILLASIERIKANMLMKKDAAADHYNTPHIDIPSPKMKSLLYYVKDSDGDTFVFNETFQEKKALTVRTRIAPRKGKAVIFDSNIWHASSNPRQNNNRIVLNFIFQMK
ncbi:MAG TPA: 2OG-Fe(II) oxygenase [Polyangia bacterium]|nr:2OG-Fe(II) oxygenase [Polyangia bacterium]